MKFNIVNELSRPEPSLRQRILIDNSEGCQDLIKEYLDAGAVESLSAGTKNVEVVFFDKLVALEFMTRFYS